MTDDASIPGAASRKAIDAALAAMFDAIESAPTPEHLLALVDRLEAADRGKAVEAA